MAVPQPAVGHCPFFHSAMLPSCTACEGRVRHPSQAEARAYCKSLFHRYCNLYNARIKVMGVPAAGADLTVPAAPGAPVVAPFAPPALSPASLPHRTRPSASPEA